MPVNWGNEEETAGSLMDILKIEQSSKCPDSSASGATY